jgi:hypothetical protein
MYFDITDAHYIKNYELELIFEDGSKGITDLSEYAESNTIFKKFKNTEYFKNYKIEYGTLIWGNGELDIAPETLYEKATNKPVKYFSHNMA